MKLENLKYLIDLRIPHKERPLLDQLNKDATNRPHVHTERVLLLPQQDLRSPVPERFHLMGKRLDRDGESPCQAKVTDLDVSLAVDEEVLWLEVTVDDALGVAVVDSTEKLVDHFLDLGLGHCFFVASHVFLQVVLDIFKNEVEFLLIWLEHNLFQAKNVSTNK